jgi:hypothetical protein
MIVPSLSFRIQQSGGGNKIGDNLSLLQNNILAEHHSRARVFLFDRCEAGATVSLTVVHIMFCSYQRG